MKQYYLVDSYSTSHVFFYSLFQHNITACRMVCYDRHGMPMRCLAKIFENQKSGFCDTCQTGPKVCLLEKCCYVYVLTKMCAPPGVGSFTDESGHLVRSCVIEDYKACIGFVDKSDRMNTDRISQRTWSWTKKLFCTLQVQPSSLHTLATSYVVVRIYTKIVRACLFMSCSFNHTQKM